jgi:hypothetical protein
MLIIGARPGVYTGAGLVDIFLSGLQLVPGQQRRDRPEGTPIF